MVNHTLLKESRRGLLPELYVNQTNCGKKQCITERCAIKMHFCNQIIAMNCAIQSKDSEEIQCSNICKSIPGLVPVVT
jgi:hypothetical protein